VKYGLHQKAIDHLHKVFSLDPLSIEARERLKDVLLAQGRTDEALGELCKLAEQVAPANPGRAEAYLREVLALSPDDPRASALAARYRLDLGGDDLEIIAEEHAPVGLGSGLLGPDPDDDEPSESFGRRAAGSGAVPVVDEEMDLDELDLEPVEDGEVESAITEDDQNYAPDEHNYYAGARGPSPASRYEADGFEFELGLGDEDDEPMLDSEAPRVASRRADSVDPRETLEVHLDQVEEAVSIADVEQEDVQFGAPPAGDLLAGPYDDGAQEEDLPFDPIDARRFDAEPGYDQDLRGALESAGDSSSILAPTGEEMPATYVPGVHHFNLSETPSPSKLGPPPPVAPPHLDPLSDLDDEDIAFDFIADVGGAPSGAPASRTMQAKVGQTVDQPLLDAGAEGDSQQGGGTSLEDDLDEADFFVGQSLWDEAREILQALLSRYPNHPLVLAKLRDADSMAAGLEPLADVLSDEAPALPELSDDAPYRESPPVAEEPRSGTGIGPGPAHVTKPVVLLEKPVEDNDGDTHYDLGLAYKEMGLHEEAIKAFQKVLTMPGREVQCHLMIGLCHREQGNLSEAINQFKAGLYVDRITLAEKFGLYYEIGTCYEALEDPQEALYYYEMVLKKDAGYRDLAPRVSAIRTSMGANGNASSSGGKRQSTLDSETDSALDHIKR
jgi:tetratricopeptide (TPR) repeat protein